MKCRPCLNGRHFIVQADHQPLIHLTKKFKDPDNEKTVGWLGRLLQYDFTAKCIKGKTILVADTHSRTSLSWPACAATVLVCDDSRFLPKLPSAYALNSHAAVNLASTPAGTCSTTLWMICFGCRQSVDYADCTFPLHLELKFCAIIDQALAGHGRVNTSVGTVCRSFWWPRVREAAEE